jgi:hypothetical protein
VVKWIKSTDSLVWNKYGVGGKWTKITDSLVWSKDGVVKSLCS